MDYFIGIDIGTSGTKTVLFDRCGQALASALSEYPMYQPHYGWAEQDPGDWWRAVCKTLKHVMHTSGTEPSSIRGVGLSGQMHGLVMLDKNDNVLRPSIIWCDQRTKRECDELTGIIGRDRIIDITANPALTGFTASKILWVRNNEPHIYEKARKMMLPKDYIRYMLTGEFATDVSDGSGMQLMDIKKREFSGEILEKLQIDSSLLARMYESPEITGRITGKAAAETSLAKGTIVVGGAGDQAAGAIGNGVVKKGIISSTIGTSGVVFAHADEMVTDPLGRVHTFCHAVPGKWHIMGVIQSAGLSLKWLRDNFFTSEMETARHMETDPYVLMDRQAGKVPQGANGIIYLPYLMGERTPHLDANARGVFFGLSAKHTKRDLLRAVLEGVVFALKDCLDIVAGMGAEIGEIRASGGGGRSALWRQMQADIFNTGIKTVNTSEGPALGAAILAMTGAREYMSVEEACANIIKTGAEQLPDKKNHEKYTEFHRIYKRLYTALKDEFVELGRLMEPATEEIQ